MVAPHSRKIRRSSSDNDSSYERMAAIARTRLALGGCLTVSLSSYQTLSQILQIGDGGIHARYIFVNKCSNLDFSGGLVGNEVLAESGQLLKKFSAPPQESHVRRKNLIT